MVAEGLNIKLAPPCGAEDSVPVCFVQDGYGTTSHTLVACYFGDIDQDWAGGDIIGCDMVWRQLSRKVV